MSDDSTESAEVSGEPSPSGGADDTPVDGPTAGDIWVRRVTIALGAAFLLLGAGFKMYNMRTYNEDFFAGPSYVGMVVGVVAIILGVAYNFLFFDDADDAEPES